MPKLSVTICPYCETQRNDSNLDGLCRFCHTLLIGKEIELPELSNSEKKNAEKFLEANRRGVGQTKTTL